MKTFSQNQLRDYSALFSRAEVIEWQKGNFHSFNKKFQKLLAGQNENFIF